MHGENVVVAETYVWSDYPGMRAGRLYAGKPDLTRHAGGQTHLAAGDDATRTLCGLPRSRFPHTFPAARSLSRRADPCESCLPGVRPGPPA
ncbi:hypothetical protein [Pseudonocardia sp. N23]|uniref:hypothetical protein n=1 Tax=Pseudonocardia sp. N23 TaxID=1987376 RepID=UPI000BFD649E|nr:hypothetical protein [Pseudonocardia sp. N23]GAY08061.1 hypothetical protein TOK_6254 [Pseudonocardia sp. N23]